LPTRFYLVAHTHLRSYCIRRKSNNGRKSSNGRKHGDRRKYDVCRYILLAACGIMRGFL
jgi:hypothetical protein